MKNLEKLIYSLPIWDESQTDQPCLEEMAKELGVVHDIEATQEDIAEQICEFLATSIGHKQLNY